MPEAVSYECPLCQKIVSIDQTEVGEGTVCPNCGRMFEAGLPVGRPVREGHTDDEIDEPDNTALDEPEDERTLYEVTPAIWRAHPFRTLLVSLIGAAAVAAVVAGFSGLPRSGLSRSSRS